MDQRLHEAACRGDVGALQELLKEDPLILFTMALKSSDTPLHIAALLGHTEFARLTMAGNPKLSRELNHHGYSPIHLASSNGHLQILTDLLNIDRGLCLLKDCEGRTPLHFAASKGRLHVIRKLLSCCPESAKELTFRGETLLHLAVKNCQCEVIISMLSVPGERNLVDELVNCVDEDGNTVLHLATARKQHRITKILLKETKVEVNSVNASGDTALDISVMSSSESDSTDIEEMVRKYAQGQSVPVLEIPHRNEEKIVVINSHEPRPNHTNTTESLSRQTQSTAIDKEFGSRALDSKKNGIIVLCSLVAAFCFEAIINPPGGVWQDFQSTNIINTTQAAHEVKKYIKSAPLINFLTLTRGLPHLNVTNPDLFRPGRAMSLSLDPYHFLQFLFADAVCFIASLVTVILVMLTHSWKSFTTFLVYLMTIIIIFFAILLYQNVLALVTNNHFATWAVRAGFAYSYFMIGIYLIGLISVAYYDEIRRMLGSICNFCYVLF